VQQSATAANGPGPGPPELTGVFNLRDLGGLPTRDGRHTRAGRLWRSDTLHRLKPADVDAIGVLGLRTVIDLRRADEVDRGGRFAVGGAATILHPVPLFADVRGVALPELQDDSTAAAVRAMADLYEQMVEQGGASLAEVVGLLGAQDALPGLFHCAAGKDRTGLVAAVVLEVVGVTDDAIAADYGRTDPSVPLAHAWLAEHDPDQAALDSRYPAWVTRAHAATMVETLTRIRARHGSVTALLRRHGVGEATLERLRRELVG
jgi:protein-tyrosine phosphatase